MIRVSAALLGSRQPHVLIDHGRVDPAVDDGVDLPLPRRDGKRVEEVVQREPIAREQD